MGKAKGLRLCRARVFLRYRDQGLGLGFRVEDSSSRDLGFVGIISSEGLALKVGMYGIRFRAGLPKDWVQRSVL